VSITSNIRTKYYITKAKKHYLSIPISHIYFINNVLLLVSLGMHIQYLIM